MFKVEYTETGVKNSTADIQKRLGGLVSTGEDNIQNIPGIPDTYTCAELKDYEIDATDEFISEFKKDADNYYSYNDCNCIDKDISIWYKKDNPIAVICVHLCGDARWGFSDDFVVEMNDYYDDCVLTQLLQLESVYQTVDINDRYYADINIFQEEYDIYDSVENDTIGCDYAIEKKDALENLKEN